ncbi:hypothetical protein [Paenibacillus sp. L3-i20]|uniref:hypothetical protein n=1 Tax=Paenibacillus sp. L3-i20 TaxID=2905833 RepID=UPI001EE0987A|nr:hypothetical protein [Paenibacillus sp. L3-i20]GKU79759.1 hypothetical protein L3i20_v241560 [Paenibacillus sp. L3-i20]
MAFGISRDEMIRWKSTVAGGEIAFLTHYWLDPRFPGMKTVTKVGCSNLDKLSEWCRSNGLNPHYIHARDQYPHFDLLGKKQVEVLLQEKLFDHLERFNIKAASEYEGN